MASYSDLLTAVPLLLENDTPQFASILQTTLVPLAEFRLSRDLNVDLYDWFISSTLTIGSPNFTRPSDLNAPRYMRILVGDEWRVIKLRMLEYLFEGYPSSTALDVPRYYAVQSASLYRIAPTPDLAYQYEFGYRRVLAPLSSTNQNNAYTDYYYDALVAGTCAEGARYVIDDRQAGLIAMWEARYTQAVQGINQQQNQQERDDTEAAPIDSENRGV